MRRLHDVAYSYHVRDSQAGDSDVRNYTYVFNVCGNTADFPRAGPDGSSCKSTTGTEPGPREVMHDPAPAFQIANWGNQVCYRLGNNGSSPANVEWSLLGACAHAHSDQGGWSAHSTAPCVQTLPTHGVEYD